jgi:lipopolysaccharide transport system ATP-binding protein
MVQVTGSEGPPTETVDMEEPFAVEMEYEIQRKVDNLQIGFRLSTADGTAVLTSSDMDGSCCNGRVRLPGLYHARCLLPGGLLSPQSYHLSFGAHVPGVQVHFFLETALELTVARTHPRGATVDDKRQGVICPVLPWNVRRAR